MALTRTKKRTEAAAPAAPYKLPKPESMSAFGMLVTGNARHLAFIQTAPGMQVSRNGYDVSVHGIVLLRTSCPPDEVRAYIESQGYVDADGRFAFYLQNLHTTRLGRDSFWLQNEGFIDHESRDRTQDSAWQGLLLV